ncbi:MAG: peptidylprolyl isomerase [Bacteroidales bacterium]|jgi:peptidyl-prolyl cis-trans isomerase SurA|nr:peptidylprolyl isomerase [Bacteroidales bacterium]
MKRIRVIIFIGMLWSTSVFGQLLTVGNQKINKEEFVRLYEKNIPNPDFSEKSLNTYLNLLIGYKLKLQQAKDLDLLQLPHVQRELKNHANQLAQPYLTDLNFLEKMLQEAHEHSLQDAHARQIMIRLSPYAKPQDTLTAYHTAMRIRERLMRGENFDNVAAEESEKSEMVAVGNREEKQISSTDLNYFSAFAMPYSIEKFIFNSKVGEFSMPLRTDIGFHIVQILDRQPTLGRITASRIFLNVANPNEEEKIKRKADSLYYLITGGTRTFEDIARQFSDDRVSGMRGGRMAEFNVTRADPKFIAQLYKMPIEVISRPFRATYGYHIVIIHSVGDMTTYEDARPELLFRLQRDPRADLIRQSFVNSLKKEHPIVETKGALVKFTSTLDSTDITGFWDYEPDANANLPLVKVGNTTATFEDFGKIIENSQNDYHYDHEDFSTFIERTYHRFIEDMLVANEMENVGKKHAQFTRDFNSYQDDVLVFEATDQLIWKKADMDTIGLYEFYESQKHCFTWPQRIQALIFKYDVRHINTESVRKFLDGSYRRRHTSEQIIDQAYKNFDPRYISVTVNVYEPGQNKIADRIDWTRLGLSKDIATGGFEKGFVYIYDYYPETCKSLEEVRATVVGLYQDLLEQQWVEELRKKYTVRINQAEFQSLIKKQDLKK